jgi:hypothetical protein
MSQDIVLINLCLTPPLPDGDVRSTWFGTGIGRIPVRFYTRVYRTFYLHANSRCYLSDLFFVFSPHLTAG